MVFKGFAGRFEGFLWKVGIKGVVLGFEKRGG